MTILTASKTTSKMTRRLGLTGTRMASSWCPCGAVHFSVKPVPTQEGP